MRALVKESSVEPGLLRYEFLRGEAEFSYYVFLAFGDADAFYEHQGASYHEQYFGEASSFVTDLSMEWLDPLMGGGSNLPQARRERISDHASAEAKAQVAAYPMRFGEWWEDR